MPYFDYECKKCGRVFEELVRPSDPPVLCPGCGSEVSKVYLQPPRMMLGFHPYNLFRNKLDDDHKPIRSVVPTNFKGGKANDKAKV